MQQHNQEFAALFNNAAMGMVAVNRDGIITLVNRFALTQFGYDKEDELIGKPIEVLIPPGYRKRHKGLRSNYHGENPHARPMGLGLDLFGYKKNGEQFPVEISLSVFSSGEAQYAIAFVNDITVRKKSEEALVRLNAELEEKVAERTQSLQEALDKEKELNELKSRFVSMASHEFRTPLSTILSSVFLLQKYVLTEDQSKREKHIQRIASSVNMLNDILNDFLSVGKIEEGRVQLRMTEVDVQQEVESIVGEMRPILKPGQTIITQHDGPSTAMLDATMLKHIIMNLVSNAIKFSPEGSPIHVITRGDSGGITLSVSDHGIGISAEDQRHLFERFFRAGNATNIQGTGLGLHIVSKYAELMGGTIHCESELDKGTTFIVTFPHASA
jgi:PAS domain S-box-containing protein